MKFIFLFWLGWLISSPALALVDMKNANFSTTFTDVQLPGSGYDLRIQRTYNSRSLFNGMFGFGWCSDFETKLTVTPEGNLMVTECGGGLEVTYAPQNFDPNSIDQTITTIVAEVKKRNPNMGQQALNNLQEELKTNQFLREEFGRQLNLRGQVRAGTVYMANGRETENIVLREGVYVRTLEDGSFERFNREGQLIQLNDRAGNYLKIDWNENRIARVVDNSGRQLVFTPDENTRRVRQITGPNDLKATYKFEGENLVEVTNSWNNTFKYRYDNLHNIVRIDYPDKTYQELAYDKDRDWVTRFRDRQGCIENYKYESNPRDPQNHFWSTVEKKCGDEVVNNSRYEFWHRPNRNGAGHYLHRVRTDNNGSVTDIVYHPVFGLPVSILRNAETVRYSYRNNGQVETKEEPFRHTSFFYRNRCNKVSDVVVRYLAPSEDQLTPTQRAQLEQQREAASVPKKGKAKAETFNGREVLKTIRTQYEYDQPRCFLVRARNTEGQAIVLRYDGRGRINRIQDQARRVITIEYDERFGKPSRVHRPGMGTMVVTYGPDGEITSVDSEEGPTVALQVATVFNGLLDMIAPAAGDTNI